MTIRLLLSRSQTLTIGFGPLSPSPLASKPGSRRVLWKARVQREMAVPLQDRTVDEVLEPR